MLEEDYTLFHNDGGVHIGEDEVPNFSQSSPEQSDSYFTLKDIECLMQSPTAKADKKVQNYMKNFNSFILEHKLKRVNQYIDTFKEFYAEGTAPEYIIAFDECNGDIDELLLNIIKPEFKEKVKKILKHRISQKDEPEPENIQQPIPEDPEDDEFVDNAEDDEDYIAPTVVEVQPRVMRQRHTVKNPVAHSKIPPAPKGVDPVVWVNWSDARRQSYLRAEEYPNAYYYRHLPPGEKQRNGSWSPQEKANFLNRVKEMRGNSTTLNGDWGLFSRTIPGRVGYQCANFYRKLVEAGEIYDSNYVKGEGGKIHHKSRIHDGKVVTKSSGKHKTVKVTKTKVIPPHKIRSLTLTFRASTEVTIPTSESEGFTNGTISRYESLAMQNPLTDMIDDITNEPIRVPAISPDGYVLDYNTWMKTLKDKRENPFTRAPCNKRQLEILTFENIDQYRDKIKNLNHNAAAQ